MTTNTSIAASPLISVVTVTYNASDSLEGTIESISKQTYPQIEHVVIDGGSSDGTVDIIRSHESFIDYWTSEPDNGIYDAMNKGVRAATGDYVFFINAGDAFFSHDTVADVTSVIREDPTIDLLYGDTRLVDGDGTSSIWRAYGIESLWMTMITSHQSTVFRRQCLVDHPYDTRMKISADFEAIYYLYTQGCVFRYFQNVIASFNTEGISQQKILQRIAERWRAVTRNGATWSMHRAYAKLMVRRTAEKLTNGGRD